MSFRNIQISMIILLEKIDQTFAVGQRWGHEGHEKVRREIENAQWENLNVVDHMILKSEPD